MKIMYLLCVAIVFGIAQYNGVENYFGFGFAELVVCVMCFIHFSRSYISIDSYMKLVSKNNNVNQPVKIKR